MSRFPQVKENIRVADKQLTEAIREEVERTNERLAGHGRVLVRPSGTEPVVRVLAEAENEEEAERLCATIAALVSRELG
jgi:phosphoglucosamine mutase